MKHQAVRRIYAALFFLCAPVTARADLPLTIEDLLTAEKRWRADVNLVYANSDRHEIDSLFTPIQVGPGQFINVPIAVTQARQNIDLLALSVGGRYGMSLDTELFARASGISQYTRMLNAGGATSDSNQQFSDAWIGINHRFSDDNETPALLGFAELALAENSASDGNELAHGKTGMIGITTYRAIDPLVLALTAGYRHSSARDHAGQRLDPGDLIFINPNIGFAVNHEVTLSSGLQWRWQQRDRIDGQPMGMRTTQTKLEFGLGYAWSKQATLQANSRADISGDSGAEIGVTWLYKFPSRFSIGSNKNDGGGDTE